MIKTVILNGTETCVKGLGGANTVIVNLGTEKVYASAAAGITPDADGVISIGSGSRDGLPDTNGTVYLLGSGEVNLRGTDESVNFNLPPLSAQGSTPAEGGGEVGLMPIMSGITGLFLPETIDVEGGKWGNCMANAFNFIDLQQCERGANSVRFTTSSRGTFSCYAEPNIMYAVLKMNDGGTTGSVITKGITSTSSSYGFNFMADNGELVYFSSRGYNISSEITDGEYHVYCASRSGTTVHFFADGAELSATVTANRGNFDNAMHLNFGLEPSCGFDLMMCAFGTEYHTSEEAKQNSLWLLNKLNEEWRKN